MENINTDAQKSFKELDVWQKSRELVKVIYRLTEKFPVNEQNALSLQIRTLALSIPANIADGASRRSAKESLRELQLAKGAIFQLEALLYVAADLGFIDEMDLNLTLESVTTSRKLLLGFIKYYRNKLKSKGNSVE
jgi:four helix bundle protein